MGVVAGIQRSQARTSKELLTAVEEAGDYLATSRPTAVNLFYAIGRMKRVAQQAPAPVAGSAQKRSPAKPSPSACEEDAALCRAIGRHGAPRYEKTARPFLPIAIAGNLATAQFGTALSPVYVAKEQGKTIKVYADETALLQGARPSTA